MNNISIQETVTFLKLTYGELDQTSVYDRSTQLIRILGSDFYNYQKWFTKNHCDKDIAKSQVTHWFIVASYSSLNTLAEYLVRQEYRQNNSEEGRLNRVTEYLLDPDIPTKIVTDIQE